jgi:hypothetical protein
MSTYPSAGAEYTEVSKREPILCCLLSLNLLNISSVLFLVSLLTFELCLTIHLIKKRKIIIYFVIICFITK